MDKSKRIADILEAARSLDFQMNFGQIEWDESDADACTELYTVARDLLLFAAMPRHIHEAIAERRREAMKG